MNSDDNLLARGGSMSNEHTPGPWTHCPGNARQHYNIEAPGRGNDSYEIAKLRGPDREANAKLIAAAPETKKQRDDLLAALDEIAGMVESLYATPDAMDDPFWQVARAAIDKATKED